MFIHSWVFYKTKLENHMVLLYPMRKGKRNRRNELFCSPVWWVILWKNHSVSAMSFLATSLESCTRPALLTCLHVFLCFFFVFACSLLLFHFFTSLLFFPYFLLHFSCQTCLPCPFFLFHFYFLISNFLSLTCSLPSLSVLLLSFLHISPDIHAATVRTRVCSIDVVCGWYEIVESNFLVSAAVDPS